MTLFEGNARRLGPAALVADIDLDRRRIAEGDRYKPRRPTGSNKGLGRVTHPSEDFPGYGLTVNVFVMHEFWPGLPSLPRAGVHTLEVVLTNCHGFERHSSRDRSGAARRFAR